MPNWCSNTLTIRGPFDIREEFVNMTKNPEGSEEEYSILSHLVPMPKVLEGTSSPAYDSPEPHPNWAVMLANGEMTQEWYDELCSTQKERYKASIAAKEATGYTDWYSWQAQNWGVKWGDCRTELIDHDPDSLIAVGGTVMRFETPWGSPHQGLLAVSAMFPSLHFVNAYIGEGEEFVGVTLYRGGTVVTDEGYDYPEIQEAIGEIPETGEDDDGWEAWQQRTQKVYELMYDLEDKVLASIN